MRTVVQALEDAAQSARHGYRFIEESNSAEPFFTYGGVERATARFGGALQSLGLKKGDRLALILPDAQDFVFAFLGALRIGVVPVPIYPPAGLRKLGSYVASTLHIINKCGARFVLTDSDIKRLLGTIQIQAPNLEAVVAVETVRKAREELQPVSIKLDDTCFLQFTSGSTSAPKGVVLTHRNVAANVHSFMRVGLKIEDGVDSGVSWLPLYHDMGLIGFVLGPLYHRNTSTFMPPLLFLKRPARWLQAISRHRGTVSFGPNFAYALCVKRVRDKDVEGVDLSSWRVAGCGAEPIRAANLHAFAEKFAPLGFNPRAMLPCYGMAEATLAIAFGTLGRGVKSDPVDGVALSEGTAQSVPEDAEGARHIVGCGAPLVNNEVQVFAPDDLNSDNPLPERVVGELRLRGPSVTSGYHDDPELTEATFAGGWLRTGDIGYLANGEVFICGRSKELIIVNGRNYYPQDLEWEASTVGGVRKGNVIAFGTRKPLGDRERVVIAFETSVGDENARAALKKEVRRAVRQATGLTIDDVVALDASVLPKTSSGKLKRAETRLLYEDGTLFMRKSAQGADPLGAAREIAKSQAGYVRHSLFGAKKGR